MNFNSKLVLCSAMTLLLAACSGGGDGGTKNYAKSTANLREVSNNFNRVQRSASVASKGNTQSANFNGKVSRSEKVRRMDDALANCQVNVLETSPSDNNFSFSLDIADPCPVTAKFYAASKGDATSMAMVVKLDMKIADPELAKINDVYAAKLDGSVNLKANGQGGKINGSIKGSISSIKFGEVAIAGSVQGGGSGGNGQMVSTLGFTIKGELHEFVETVTAKDGQETQTYAINGQEVSKDEYETEFKRLGFLGQGIMTDETSDVPPEDTEIPEEGQVGVPNKPGEGKPSEPMPNETQCRAEVISLKPHWGVTEVKTACAGAAPTCVYKFIQDKPSWGASEIGSACQYSVYVCTRMVFPMKPAWTSSELVRACDQADVQCVQRVLSAKPYLSASEVNGLCRN